MKRRILCEALRLCGLAREGDCLSEKQISRQAAKAQSQRQVQNAFYFACPVMDGGHNALETLAA
jgi:hypothetical protein